MRGSRNCVKKIGDQKYDLYNLNNPINKQQKEATKQFSEQ